jgi:hypothetical protein
LKVELERHLFLASRLDLVARRGQEVHRGPPSRRAKDDDRKWTGSGPGRYQCDPVLGQS